MLEKELAKSIVGATIKVHREPGPGPPGSAYEECLAHELTIRGVASRRQDPLPLPHKGVQADRAYRIDAPASEAVDTLTPIHSAQLLTDLRISRKRTGLPMNFNTAVLKDGIVRMVP